jgi:hypothetical protein
LHRAYGHLGDYYGEIYFIPQQLLDALPPPDGLDVAVASVPPAAQTVADGDALAEDAFAILAFLRRERIPAHSSPDAVDESPLAFRQLDWGPRFVGEASPERLDLIWRLLRQGDLVRPRGVWLRPAPQARTWLQSGTAERMSALFEVWRGDRNWNPLASVDGLLVEKVDPDRSPMIARERLLAILAECPTETWLSCHSLVRFLQRREPYLMRSDDEAAWLIRDALSGEYLHGPDSWDRVEGQVILRVMTDALRWLGVTETGYNAEAAAPASFRITAWGAEVLGARDGGGRESPGSPPAGGQGTVVPAVVDDDLQVRIVTRDTLYERYQLERFADWKSQDDVALYRITPDSVWRGLNTGIKVEQIEGFLRRLTEDRVPPSALLTLRAWAGKYGGVTLHSSAVLESVDEGTMQQISADRRLASLLGRPLTSTVRLVDPENVEAVVARLKELGIWPRVRI